MSQAQLHPKSKEMKFTKQLFYQGRAFIIQKFIVKNIDKIIFITKRETLKFPGRFISERLVEKLAVSLCRK